MLKKTLSAALVVALLGIAGSTNASEKPFRVAVLSFGESGEYMHLWTTQIKTHPWVENGKVKITIFDGKFDPLVQSNQVDTAITQKYDAIVIAPIDFNAAGPAINKAIAAGIPVVSSALSANTSKMTSTVIVDDVVGGRMIAEAMGKELHGKGAVVLLEGPIGQSSQIARRKGIDTGLKETPDIKLIASKSGNWSRAEGQTIMDNWLTAYPGKIQGVISENDEMALGAIQAMKARKIDFAKVPVIAIDGIPDGKRAVADGEMRMTLYKYARAEGQGALDVALRAVVGPSYQPQSDVWGKLMQWNGGNQKLYTVPWLILTKGNVAQYMK
ncbi:MULTISPECIES: substrate-binding domain-containing protein [unclassified Burkholderia]|uniref:substrate-binding domain-containing protein n=1 Tax=unclassified Burkholderia TaxID=2613784 RepID=UPI000F5740BE|nr:MULTISPECIES: substrate-binding domain-containing protein [unclassified Burkholderia]RQS26901.1 sugar ABC transporter substrate-binding protein [Burkholderia sp. Bp8995]RQS51802.1 sugar ABC transporter substrate-binding protein [Burkholderia sp. Bp8989]